MSERGIHHRRIHLGVLICAVGVVAIGMVLASCGGDGGKSDSGVLMRVRTGSGPETTRKPTTEEKAELRTEIEVVKNYWALPYVSQYDLFSSSFKQILREAHSITNASDYARVMSTNKRQWLKQTYEKADLTDPANGQVTVLVEWEESGYSGVASVIFDMIKEGGEWKISSIFF